VVLPGACIGRNVVIAAGSVVRGTVPDRCVVAGVPARVVRSYVPGDGWSPSSGPAPSGPASVSAWTGPGAVSALLARGDDPWGPRRRARRGRRHHGRPARLAARPPAWPRRPGPPRAVAQHGHRLLTSSSRPDSCSAEPSSAEVRLGRDWLAFR
jgi:hypothetical protein